MGQRSWIRWIGVYPSGRVITYAYDSVGRALSAVNSASGVNYALGASYAPHGALASVVHGQTGTFTGINLNQAFNNRLQPTTIAAWSTNGVAVDFSYSFNHGVANNGNLAAINDLLNAGRTQSFTYDELNRIQTAQTAAHEVLEAFSTASGTNQKDAHSQVGKLFAGGDRIGRGFNSNASGEIVSVVYTSQIQYTQITYKYTVVFNTPIPQEAVNWPRDKRIAMINSNKVGTVSCCN